MVSIVNSIHCARVGILAMYRPVLLMIFLYLIPFRCAVSSSSQSEWTTWTTTDGLPDYHIQAITAGTGSEIWVGTDYGAARFEGQTWKTYTTADGLAKDRKSVV